MSRRKAEKEARKVVRDYSLAIGGSILVALFIRFFVIEAYRMPSRAMQPAVEPGDTLFVEKYAYGIRIPGADRRLSERPPNYGDVAVLEFPEEPGREYIKRIVGLPGDKIQLVKGALVLNGKTVTTQSVGEALCTTESLPNAVTYTVCMEPPLLSTETTITVPPGHAFVVGDFRTAPDEIRKLRIDGIVPFLNLHGRAQFVWLSIQPASSASGGDWFSRIRFNRIFQRIK
jgi:signal peptidase I